MKKFILSIILICACGVFAFALWQLYSIYKVYSDADKARLFAYMRKINEAVIKVVESVGDK